MLIYWLKFRCPYNQVNYEYYEGDIYIQPYGRDLTSESRLLLKKNPAKKIYNVNKYIGQFYYFNLILRPMIYKSLIGKHHILDNCWDCTAFQHIIKII